MITWQLILLAAGTAVIRLLHVVRRRLAGPNRYFSFSDFLDEEIYVHSGGFILGVLPPFIGGFLISLFPSAQAPVAAAAGCLAALLGVWPVMQHPYQVLDEHMQHYWPKLRFIYVLFIVSSSAISYVGFLLGRETIPMTIALVGTTAWQNFVDDVAANALYDIAKFLVLALLSIGGYVAYTGRQKVGEAALNRLITQPPREETWPADIDVIQATDEQDGDEGPP